MNGKGRTSKQESAPIFCPSAFTLTFVLEVVGLDVWHDCNEGWVELGSPLQEIKLVYRLFPEQTFEVNVVIWSHVAKVYSEKNYGWVRTWQFLERRWLTFSIRHAFPIRVSQLRDFVATVTPTSGLGALSSKFNSKNEITPEVYLPPLRFGERRQFGEVIESECPLTKYIEDMILFPVMNYIPCSVIDGLLETPYPVNDVRHQDAAIYQVQDVILNKKRDEKIEEEVRLRKSKLSSLKKMSTLEKNKYEITLPGDWILAGVGRVTPFISTGDCPIELGEVIALISSSNLPAQDDFPIFFVNVCNLTDVPIKHLTQNSLSKQAFQSSVVKCRREMMSTVIGRTSVCLRSVMYYLKPGCHTAPFQLPVALNMVNVSGAGARFTHIYTRWTIREEERNSEQQPLETKEPKIEFNFNDHHSVPLPSDVASDVMVSFLDEPFRVEVRGIRIPPPANKTMNFFGYEKADRYYDRGVPPRISNQAVDILIAHTQIDARALTKINGFVKGEFPLYPPQTSVVPLDREEICTNDVNAVRAKVKPDLFVQPGVILEAQMTIEVSMGLVGSNPKSNVERYSRLYCLISNREAIMALLRQITEINEAVMQTESKAGLLTGFALDTGDTVILYVEGPKEGQILRVWERTEDFYPTVKPVFSTSAKYSCRLYPELLLAVMPFNIIKMFVPLSVLLSLTPIYARPALPLPTRSAVLKIGRLVASKFKTAPRCHMMPTATELKTFRLELCVAPRPPLVYDTEIPRILPEEAFLKRESTPKINWHPKELKYSSNPQNS